MLKSWQVELNIKVKGLRSPILRSYVTIQRVGAVSKQ